MSWSTTAPSGITWSGDWLTSSERINVNNYNNYRIQSRIGRGANNTIAIAVRLQVYGRTYGVTGAVPLYAQVSVGGTSAWSATKDPTYDCTGSYGSWSTAKTIYYTTTAAAGAAVYVRGSWQGNNTGNNKHTAPAYKTTYAVTYNGNGATGGSTEGQTKTYATTLKLQSNGYTRTGYTFTGWNTAANGSGTSYAAGASYTANSAVTLYAQWTPLTYAVTYNGNGATSGSTAAQTKTYGVSITLRGNGYTRTGYTFAGWNTSANGSGAGYAAGASYTANSAVTLYAQWTPIGYAVEYDGNGADGGSTAAQTKIYGTSLTLQDNGFSRTGYSFTGWNTSADGSGSAYAAGASYTANSAVTLYAQWTPLTYAVTYDGNGAEEGSTEPQTKIYGTALRLQSNGYVREGYSFTGWNTAQDGTGADYPERASYTANEEVTLYAQWKKNNIPVFLNLDGRIRQAEKAYVNDNGTIRECTMYTNVDGVIIELT